MKAKRVILVVMDGIGSRNQDFGNAVKAAHTPTLERLMLSCPHTEIKAHGTAVGMPSDADMGNSEVGHNALGCGQIYAQGAKLVDESIKSGKMFLSVAWKGLIENCKKQDSTLHFIGLLSDGNVHSNIRHLVAMLRRTKAQGVRTARIHALLDGRDTPPRSALKYVRELQDTLAELNDTRFDAQIASGGGRTCVTMDRYGADWRMVETGWKTHVLGEGRSFENPVEAIETYRKEYNVDDQNLPPFVIAKEGKPVGEILDHDSVILFNFRGDRAIELSLAFEQEDFKQFDRVRFPRVQFAGMLQYDGDLQLPKKYLVSPPDIQNTLSELLIQHGLRQFAVSETQKYGHVTYFWNGNRSEKLDEKLETFAEVKSDRVPFNQRPWMKSAEIADAVIEAIQSNQYDFIRCNFPNGDMVGHTGDYDATVLAVESVDLALRRIVLAADQENAALLITADHGNAETMKESGEVGKEQIITAHSLSAVPFIIYSNSAAYHLKDGAFGLANVAPTIARLFGLSPFAAWEESMLRE